jgi:hypothetical protein
VGVLAALLLAAGVGVAAGFVAVGAVRLWPGMVPRSSTCTPVGGWRVVVQALRVIAAPRSKAVRTICPQRGHARAGQIGDEGCAVV